MENECENVLEHCNICEKLTEFYLSKNPEKKGRVFCQKCIEEMGIVPIICKIDSLPIEMGYDNSHFGENQEYKKNE